MRILSCYDVYSGCAWYRSTVPVFEAANQGHQVSVVQGGIPREGVETCDVLMVQRIWHPDGMAAIKRANELGKRTVYDLDDDLWAIGSHNMSRSFWDEHRDFAVEIMRQCDVVTTTQDTFADFLRTMHADVRVCPNCLPDDMWPRVPHVERGTLTIGWAGGNSHKGDLALIADVLMATVEKHHNVHVALVGALGDWLPYHPRIHHWSVVATEDYQRVLTGFDIGLAPLDSGPRFNRHKSDLKALEYAAVSIPVIASPHYENVPGVRIARKYSDWMKHLDALIASKQTRITEGLRLRDWAETRMMSRNMEAWYDAWTS